MKALIAALAVTMTIAATGVFADPIYGVWQTQPDDGAYAHVEIGPCGADICGTIIRTFKDGKEFQSENTGKQLVRDMKPAGKNHYKGKVWRPSNNKIYIGKIDLNGNSMNLRGCVVGGLICAKQTWGRVQ